MQLSVNFSFLEVHNLYLAKLGTLAERYLHDDPNTCIIKLRQFSEILAQQIAVQVGICISVHESQFALLERLQNCGIIKDKTRQLFHELRITGNQACHLDNHATHWQREDSILALKHLKYAYELGVWYHRAFGKDKNFKPNPFQMPADSTAEEETFKKDLESFKSKAQIAEELAEDESKRRQELEVQVEELKTKYQEILEKTQAEVAKQSSEQIHQIITQIKEAENYIPSLLQIFNEDKKDNEVNIEGFVNFGVKLERVSSALRNIAILIGECQEEYFILESGETVQAGLGLTSETNVLNNRANDVQQGICKLIVLGEFKHGKSTLLNAMLGSKKLPAKTTPATAIITVLVYGKNDGVAIYEANKEEPRQIAWQSFVKEFQLGIEDRESLANKNFINRFQNIKYAQVECQSSLCKSGVRLIDSPGLAEHISRTKVTTEFLKQSQAVIFVLNATQILGQNEREFIDNNFPPGRINNVFFVVNRIDQVEEEEIEEIKDYVRDYLQDYYIKDTGEVDLDLLNRRLFFVNAKGALDARMQEQIAKEALARSGVPALERELEHFLTTNQRFEAAMTSTVNFLIAVIDKARTKNIQAKKTLAEPLVFLEKRRVEADKRLHFLNEKIKRIDRLVAIYQKVITDKLCRNFLLFIQESKETWHKDHQKFINLDKLNVFNLTLSVFDSFTKKSIAEQLNKGIDEYFDNKLKIWSERIPLLIESDFNDFSKDIELEIKHFAKEITEIESIFVGKKSTDLIDLAENKGEKIIQLLIKLLMGDFSQIPGTIMGNGDWSGFIMDSLQQVFIVNAILAVFGGPIEWIILIVTELVMGIYGHNQAKDKLISDIGQKVFKEIENKVPEIQWKIQEHTEFQFQKLSKNITNLLQEQINEVRNEQNRIIAQKQDENFSIERENERMEKIETAILNEFNKISQLVYGRTHTLEELQWIAQGKNLMNIREAA